MKTTKIKVSYTVTFEHDDTWSDQELKEVALDTISGRFSQGFTCEGIKEWGISEQKAKDHE